MIQSGKYLLTPQSSKIYRTAIRLFTIGSPAEKLVGSVNSISELEIQKVNEKN